MQVKWPLAAFFSASRTSFSEKPVQEAKKNRLFVHVYIVSGQPRRGEQGVQVKLGRAAFRRFGGMMGCGGWLGWKQCRGRGGLALEMGWVTP